MKYVRYILGTTNRAYVCTWNKEGYAQQEIVQFKKIVKTKPPLVVTSDKLHLVHGSIGIDGRGTVQHSEIMKREFIPTLGRTD